MTLIVSIFALIAVIAAAIVGMVWSGYVMAILWGWFAVPIFNVAHISTFEASGLILMVALATAKYRNNVKSDPKWERLAFMFIAPLLSLGFGWIIKSWM